MIVIDIVYIYIYTYKYLAFRCIHVYLRQGIKHIATVSAFQHMQFAESRREREREREGVRKMPGDTVTTFYLSLSLSPSLSFCVIHREEKKRCCTHCCSKYLATREKRRERERERIRRDGLFQKGGV